MTCSSALVVDATHLVHRSRRASDTRSHVMDWLHLLQNTACAGHVVSVFDSKHGGNRRRRTNHSGYKAKANVRSSSFGKAWETARAAALEIPNSSVVVAPEDWEADDVIACMCRDFCPGGNEWYGASSLYVASADSDMQQVLRPEITWIQLQTRPTKSSPHCITTVTYEDFVQQFGFSPNLYPDYLALKGKPDINVSGVGVGAKGARKLIRAYGGVADVFDAAAEGKIKGWGSHVRAALTREGAREQAMHNLSLFAAGEGLEGGLMLASREAISSTPMVQDKQEHQTED